MSQSSLRTSQQRWCFSWCCFIQNFLITEKFDSNYSHGSGVWVLGESFKVCFCWNSWMELEVSKESLIYFIAKVLSFVLIILNSELHIRVASTMINERFCEIATANWFNKRLTNLQTPRWSINIKSRSANQNDLTVKLCPSSKSAGNVCKCSHKVFFYWFNTKMNKNLGQ